MLVKASDHKARSGPFDRGDKRSVERLLIGEEVDSRRMKDLYMVLCPNPLELSPGAAIIYSDEAAKWRCRLRESRTFSRDSSRPGESRVLCR